MIDQKSLKITIMNSENVVTHETASALTSFNHLGIFDILPEHENFISIIEKQIIIYGIDGSKKAFDINKGVLKVAGDEVDIYLETVSKTAAY